MTSERANTSSKVSSVHGQVMAQRTSWARRAITSMARASRAPWATARAAPPLPRMATRLPVRLTLASLSASAKPSQSVLWPISRLPSICRQLTAPMARASGDRSSHKAAVVSLCGRVTLAPRKRVPRRPVSVSARRDGSTDKTAMCAAICSSAKPALCKVGLSEWWIG